MSLNYNKYCRLSLVSLSIAANTTIAVNAKDLANSLPQPNSLEQQAIPSSRGNQFKTNLGSREYRFKAPNNKTLSNIGQLTAPQGYTVEVYGNAAELLLQVKNIEPTAFVKGNIIQVGIFSHQHNAEQMVRKLTAAGFWSRMVTD